MTNLDLGTYAAKRHSWSDGPRAAYLRIKRAHPDASVDERGQLLSDEMAEDEAIRLAIAVHYTAAQDRNSEAHFTMSRSERKNKKRQNQRDMEKLKYRIGKIVLMNLIMPNGKQLCECTGTECKSFGGWLAKVGEQAGKKKVGECLTEKQLWALKK